MHRFVKLSIASCALSAAMFLFSGSAPAFAPGAAKDAKEKAAAKVAAVSAVSEKEIADAKAKGLVWVNLDSKIYHKSGQFYGKTKQGKFMTEADAQKAGYRAAKESAVTKKSESKKK